MGVCENALLDTWAVSMATFEALIMLMAEPQKIGPLGSFHHHYCSRGRSVYAEHYCNP
jgi:hypothetical protein